MPFDQDVFSYNRLTTMAQNMVNRPSQSWPNLLIWCEFAAFLVLAGALAMIRDRRTKMAAMATIVVAAAEFVYLWSQGRVLLRAWSGVAIYSLCLFLLAFPFDTMVRSLFAHSRLFQKGTAYKAALLLLLTGGVMGAVGLVAWLDVRREKAASAEGDLSSFHALHQYVQEHAETVYFSIDSTAGNHYDKTFLRLKSQKGQPQNLISLFGWHLHTPSFRRQLRLAGLSNPVHAMTAPNVRLVVQPQCGDSKMQALQNYMRVVYGVGFLLHLDDVVANHFYIYRLLPVQARSTRNGDEGA